MSDSPFDRFSSGPLDGYLIDERGSDVRLRGFAIVTDLARHYSLVETWYLAVTGELPDEMQAHATKLALFAALNVPIASGAAHATRLARHLADPSDNEGSVVATAALSAAEHSRHQLDTIGADLFRWLESDRLGPLPSTCRTTKSADLVRALHDASAESGLPLDEFFSRNPSTTAAIMVLFWTAGIRTQHQMAGLLAAARLPLLVAEAFAVEDASLWSYPLNLPFWNYVGEEE